MHVSNLEYILENNCGTAGKNGTEEKKWSTEEDAAPQWKLCHPPPSHTHALAFLLEKKKTSLEMALVHVRMRIRVVNIRRNTIVIICHIIWVFSEIKWRFFSFPNFRTDDLFFRIFRNSIIPLSWKIALLKKFQRS